MLLTTSNRKSGSNESEEEGERGGIAARLSKKDFQWQLNVSRLIGHAYRSSAPEGSAPPTNVAVQTTLNLSQKAHLHYRVLKPSGSQFSGSWVFDSKDSRTFIISSSSVMSVSES